MKHYIYILTDSSRKTLQVGITHDLSYTIDFCKALYSLYFDSHKRCSRLVYFEEMLTKNQALKRFEEISGFTRTQQERIIRSSNADWRDLSLLSGFEFLAAATGFDRQKQVFAS